MAQDIFWMFNDIVYIDKTKSREKVKIKGYIPIHNHRFY